jgi:hypothetical protein
LGEILRLNQAVDLYNFLHQHSGSLVSLASLGVGGFRQAVGLSFTADENIQRGYAVLVGLSGFDPGLHLMH